MAFKSLPTFASQGACFLHPHVLIVSCLVLFILSFCKNNLVWPMLFVVASVKLFVGFLYWFHLFWAANTTLLGYHTKGCKLLFVSLSGLLLLRLCLESCKKPNLFP